MRSTQSSYVLFALVLFVLAGNQQIGVMGAVPIERFCYKNDIQVKECDPINCNRACYQSHSFRSHSMGYCDLQPPYSCSCYVPC
ncbi:hypothetical protein LINGRAHAP2_LOCUS8355 [Linum grandiflorum]